jgi:hypothetical protein
MPTTSPKTKSGTRKLSEVAKHLTVPIDITSTGWPAVRNTCRDKLGVRFDDWQDQIGRIILAKRSDRTLAAMIDGVGMSLPRQVGKTYLVGALVFALCINQPGLLVIWSAHHSRTHGETFLAMQGFADRAKVAPHVQQVYTGSGDEEIRFHNGSRILFGARERGFGRGIPGVDVLIFDEAQILSDKALANMLATMNTSHFGLQLYIGTPPKPEDMSEAFTRMRNEALAGTLTDGAWIELGADDDADVNDWKQLAKANPSYPHRTPKQSILRLKRKLTDEDFRREGMGVWDVIGSASVIDTITWHEDRDPASMAIDRLALGIQVSPDRTITTVGLAGQRADGLWHVEVDEQRNGVDWAVDWVADRCTKNNIRAVVIDGQSQAATLEDALKARKITVTVIGTREVAASAGTFVDKAIGTPAGVDADGKPVEAEPPTLRHLDQPLLNASNGAAGKHEVMGGKSWVWTAKHAALDITPTQSVSLALWGAMNSNVKKPARKRTGGRKVVTG